jgi:hypothetical protein
MFVDSCGVSDCRSKHLKLKLDRRIKSLEIRVPKADRCLNCYRSCLREDICAEWFLRHVIEEMEKLRREAPPAEEI